MPNGEIRFKIHVDNSQMTKMEIAIQKATVKCDKLSEQLDKIRSKKTPTEAYTELNKQLETAYSELDKLVAKQREYEAAGANIGIPYENIVKQVDAAGLKVGDLELAIDRLNEEGRAFTFGDPAAETSKTNELSIAQAELIALNSRYSELQSKNNAVSSGFKKLGATVIKVNKLIRKFLLDGISKFKEFIKSSHSSSNAIERFGKRVWGLAKRVFVFSLITKSFRSMISAMKTGFSDFEGESESFKQAMDNMRLSTNVLGAQLSSAFAPIVEATVNLFTRLVTQISLAVGYIAQFIAFIGGSSTYKKAVANNKILAGSLDGVADSAKGALASFDDLDVLANSSKSGSGSSAELPTYTWEDADIDFDFEDLDPYELGANLAKKIADALENIDWDEVEKKAENLGRTLAQFMNGVFADERLARELGQAIAGLINAGVGFVYGWSDDFNFRQLGVWIGVLINEAIRNTDSKKIGSTIANLINGAAYFVLGFLETYEWGSLSNAIAITLSTAISETDAASLGDAFGGLIALGLTEIKTFSQNTEWRKLGTRIAEFINHSAEQVTAEDVGEALASIINAGFELFDSFLKEADFQALGVRLTQSICEGTKNIDWSAIGSSIVESLRGAGDFLEGMQKEISAQIIGAFAGEETEQLYREAGLRVKRAIDEGFLTSANDIAIVGNKFGLTTVEVQKLCDYLDGKSVVIEPFGTAIADAGVKAETTSQKVSELNSQLENTEGTATFSDSVSSAFENTNLFSASIFNTIDMIGILAGKSKDATGEVDEIGNVMKNSAGASTDWANSVSSNAGKVDSSLATTSSNASKHGSDGGKNYTTEFANALDGAKSAINAAGTNFDTELASGIESGKDTVTTAVSDMTTSMQTVLSESFTKESWDLLFANMNIAYEEQWAIFSELWLENLEAWTESNEELYFGYDVWETNFTNIIDSYDTVWALFLEEWTANMQLWWSTLVEPYFTVEQWTLFGTQMKTGIVTGLKVCVKEIGGIMNKVIDIFNSALNNVKDSINDLVDQFNDIAAALGVDAISKVSVKSIPHVNIPELANGAVIRGGNPFYAMLGDQPLGRTNIETPLDTMVEAFETALDGRGAQNITLKFTGNLAQLGRVLKPVIDAENDRIGTSFEIITE